MQPTSIRTSYSRALTWDEARALAQRWGDDLTTRMNFDYHHPFSGELETFIGQAWVGVTKVDGAATFLDGTAVRDRYPGDGYEIMPGFQPYEGFTLQIDGLDGPERHGYLEARTLAFAEDAFTDQLIWDTASLNVVGTPYSDSIEPADISGKSIDLAGGNDFVIVDFEPTAPASVKMGSGHDWFYMNKAGRFDVWDGAGIDYIQAGDGTIHAALDGDGDYYEARKITYDGATAPIRVIYDESDYSNVMTGTEIGADKFEYVEELYLGSGDDRVEGVFIEYIYTKGGDDFVRFADAQNPGTSQFVDGGDGNDTLIAGGYGGRLVGGAGADILAAEGWSGGTRIEMTGGSGADTFRFGPTGGSSNGKAVINDFAANGAVQDMLDLTAFDLDAASAADAIGLGLISLSTMKGYTYLTVEGGAEAGYLTLMLKGIYGTNIVDNIVV